MKKKSIIFKKWIKYPCPLYVDIVFDYFHQDMYERDILSESRDNMQDIFCQYCFQLLSINPCKSELAVFEPRSEESKANTADCESIIGQIQKLSVNNNFIQ